MNNRKHRFHIDTSTYYRHVLVATILSQFFLADIAFTMLPIVVISVLKSSFGTLDSNILFISEWAFAAVILSSLALTRILELKVLHQGDRSERVLLLSRICILLIIFSVVCLTFYTMKDQGLEINRNFVLALQFFLIFFSIMLLFLVHFVREKLSLRMKMVVNDMPLPMFNGIAIKILVDARDVVFNLGNVFKKISTRLDDNNDYNLELLKVRSSRIDQLISELEDGLILLKKYRAEAKQDKG